MAAVPPDRVELQDETHVVRMRHRVREWAAKLGFTLVDQTKLVTAASELARNAVVHGGGGVAEIQPVENNGRRGLRITFVDHGPGIPDVALALRDGFTTAEGLGLGLGGAKRLVHDMRIESAPGAGTTVTITRWK